MTATSISMSMRLPPERISTNSVITKLTPVSDTVPTMMPAAAVATPMPTMLRAPVSKTVIRSAMPFLKSPPMLRAPRMTPMMGFCVRMMKIMNMVVQNADIASDSCSAIRHHTSTTTASKWCRPERTVGPVSGNSNTGAFGSSS